MIPWRDLCHLIKSTLLIYITKAWSISWTSSSELIRQVCRWTLFLNPLTYVTLWDLFDGRSTIYLLHSYFSWVKSLNKQIGYDICLSDDQLYNGIIFLHVDGRLPNILVVTQAAFGLYMLPHSTRVCFAYFVCPSVHMVPSHTEN